MKRNAIFPALLVVLGLISGVTQAVAQQTEPGIMGPGWGPGMMMRESVPGGMMNMMMGCPMMTTSGGPMSTFTDGRIAFLKAELGITDARKSVWDAYAEAIKRNLQSMQGM